MPHNPEIATWLWSGKDGASAGDRPMRALFDTDLAGIFRVTWDGVILDCNDGFAHMLGLASAADVWGRTILDFYADPAERPRLLAELELGEPISSREVCLRRADGSTIWILGSASRVSSATSPPEIVGAAIDITSRKRMTDALLESEAR